MKKTCLIIYCSLLFIGCKHKGKNNENACNGNTRREVKICTDSKATLINLAPIKTTIDSLNAIVVPTVNTGTARLPLEQHTYTVTAKVDKVKKEWDGDYHIRLTNGTNYLICEMPNPMCEYASKSAYVAQYNKVKAVVENNDLENKIITITGVAFIDIDHYYSRKQAKNNIELHPILEIKF